MLATENNFKKKKTQLGYNDGLRKLRKAFLVLWHGCMIPIFVSFLVLTDSSLFRATSLSWALGLFGALHCGSEEQHQPKPQTGEE